jgi:uncharacterized membrane protein YdjX (TVP38/TMEM64 family)
MIILICIIVGFCCTFASTMLLLRQPTVFSEDISSYAPGASCNSGPCAKFMGNENGVSWGPLAGWWLAIAASFAATLVFLLGCRQRKRLGYKSIH